MGKKEEAKQSKPEALINDQKVQWKENWQAPMMIPIYKELCICMRFI